MIRQTAMAACTAALCLLLAGCGDPRRELVREYLQSHPPEGFEIAAIPEKISIVRNPDGTAESVLMVKYRLRQPTIEVRDALTLPRGETIAKEINTLRGWALSSLPAGNSTREEIMAAAAGARSPIPFKRVVTPAGTEVEAVAILALHQQADVWQVTTKSLAPETSGQPDDAAIPLENSAEVAARLDELDALAGKLEATREAYLAERERIAARSLADLQERLQTGNTFAGRAAGGIPVRLVIAQGLGKNLPAVAVLTVLRSTQASAARFTGTAERLPSGQYAWRGAQMATLSGNEPSLDSSLHPVLTLSVDPTGLSAQIKTSSYPAATIRLSAAEKVDLIPDYDHQGVDIESVAPGELTP